MDIIENTFIDFYTQIEFGFKIAGFGLD